MKKLLMLVAIFLAYVEFGAAQHNPAPTYHAPAPAYHAPAPAYHAPAQHTTPRSTTPRSTTPRSTTPRQSQQHQSHTNNPKPGKTQGNANHDKHNADREKRNADRDKRNADRNKRNADRNAAKAHGKAVKQENKARQARNKQVHRDNKAARAAFRNGRFNERYYGANFGRYHHFGFCGAGRFWMGSPYASPFWFGGVEFGFAPGVFWPGAWGRCDEFYIEYLDGVGYALVDPAYADVTLPLAVDIDAQPMDEPYE